MKNTNENFAAIYFQNNEIFKDYQRQTLYLVEIVF